MYRNYEHTQFGTLIVTVFAVFFALMAVFWVGTREPLAFPASLLAFLVIVALLSGWLTIRIDGERLRWRFGIGLIGGSAQVAEIADAQMVRNPWWYGWGMHLTSRGWVYNVSGLDAIEVKLAGGRTFRLGTDEPQKLLDAIHEAQSAKGVSLKLG